MWEVYEHRHVVKGLPKLPDSVLKRYEKWKDIVKISGPQGLRVIKGFHDEELRGEWDNHRSSRLTHKYRVIYQIEAQDILVYVVSLTVHDSQTK